MPRVPPAHLASRGFFTRPFLRFVYFMTRRAVGKVVMPVQAMAQLTEAIVWENHRARFNHAFGLESEGFSEGAFCPDPARTHRS